MALVIIKRKFILQYHLLILCNYKPDGSIDLTFSIDENLNDKNDKKIFKKIGVL